MFDSSIKQRELFKSSSQTNIMINFFITKKLRNTVRG